MSQIKLKVKTVTQKYPILIGSNLISKLSKIFNDNSIQFKQCLLVIDKNIPKKAIYTLKRSLKKKKIFIFFIKVS